MAQSKSFTVNEKSRNILKQLHDHQSLSFNENAQLLADFRILTREKTIDPSILNEYCLKTLVNLASKGQVEAQKCLSNIILNYSHLREVLVEPYVHCIEQRLKDILSRESDDKQDDESRSERPHCELLYHDLRIIFLLSALCSTSRAAVRDRLLNPLLRVTLLEAELICRQNYLLVIESLKTLFNLTMDRCVDATLAAKLIKKLSALVNTKDLESFEHPRDDHESEHTDNLLVNLIHLLTNMPEEVYLQLSDEDVDKVLKHLDEQLKTYTKASFRDTILPVLNTCANICRHKETVRKRWFEQILGSTKEFDKRPEECDSLRGRLVKLMRSVDIHVKEIAADFLYALCGCDTEKFITYTGFGNCAAYLSGKGLLSGNGSQKPFIVDYGSNDEYKEIREKIDPITGRIEQPRQNPMHGMSEEEKEWHAHELAGAITKLSNLGVIKPMHIGPTGSVSDICPEVENLESNSDNTKSIEDSKP